MIRMFFRELEREALQPFHYEAASGAVRAGEREKPQEKSAISALPGFQQQARPDGLDRSIDWMVG